ncbi:MAG: M3 family metallopeptidase [Bdellovibrionota bacterium]
MTIKKAAFDDAFDFSSLSMDVYKASLSEALTKGRERLVVLKTRKSADDPVAFFKEFSDMSFELEEFGQVFFSLLGSDGTPEMHAYSQEISPELSKYENEIGLDTELFKKIDEALTSMKAKGIEGEWTRFAEKVHRSFVQNGVNLPEDKKTLLRKIDEELGLLSLKFSENLVKETAAFKMLVADEADLKGLPDREVEAAKQKAESQGLKGWLFTLDAPTYVSFVTYAEKRELREKMWRAYASRGLSKEFDNREMTARIAELRQQRAELLGFQSHASYVLKERMAKNPETVLAFIKRIIEVAKPKAEKELEQIKEFAKAEGYPSPLKAWDLSFLSEKYKKKHLDFDEEELRPYFKLENVISGLFTHATKLFGITFKQRTDIPPFHPENKIFELSDADGSYLGLLYMDLFPRAEKRPGAWMGTFRGQGTTLGKKRRPHVMNVCNFTKPTSTKPSLISFGEVETLFHEFGHALHELLSDCEVKGLAGTNVHWDFVELPSQIQENWVNHPEGLKLVASHYETGAAMPQDLVDKIAKSKKFLAAMASLRQAQLALLDMTWHHVAKIQGPVDIEDFERKTLGPIAILEKEPGTAISTSFAHIFSGGYSSGYYSYKWAEVLDADAFEYFLENGIYNQDVAKKFRAEVLSRGNSEDPELLYEKFRGRKPDPNALFRRDGLL